MLGVSCVRAFAWIIWADAENIDIDIWFDSELLQPPSTRCGGGYCVEDECADGLTLNQLRRLIDELLNATESAIAGEEPLRNPRLLENFAAAWKREEGNISLLLGNHFGNPLQRETFIGCIDLSYFCHIQVFFGKNNRSFGKKSAEAKYPQKK